MARQVNLIADKLACSDQMHRQVLRIVGFILLYAAVAFVICSVVKVPASRMSPELIRIQSEAANLRQQNTVLGESLSQNAQGASMSNLALSIRRSNRACQRAMSDLTGQMPGGMFLDQMTLDASVKNPTLELSGTALSLEDVATFMGNLSQTGLFGKTSLDSTELEDFNGIAVAKFKCSIALRLPGAKHSGTDSPG